MFRGNSGEGNPGTGGRIRPRHAARLHVYLNVIECDPGIYGAESTRRYYDGP